MLFRGLIHPSTINLGEIFRGEKIFYIFKNLGCVITPLFPPPYFKEPGFFTIIYYWLFGTCIREVYTPAKRILLGTVGVGPLEASYIFKIETTASKGYVNKDDNIHK